MMIKVGSDFSGVGAFDQALMRLGIEHETVFSCDMDKYARQTYTLNFGEPAYYPMNVYDREIPSESLDIYMSSPPCQAFSLAGKRKGEADKRGILFYNTHEFICKNRPRYFIIENVKGLLSDAGGKTFQNWLDLLGGKSINGKTIMFPNEDAAPYHIHYQVLNAKHYGVPQNRERVFIVGIRDDEDNNFRFPAKVPLTKRLRDVLESEVEEKYYLSEKMIDSLINCNENFKDRFNPNDGSGISTAVTARYHKMAPTDTYIQTEQLGFINQDTQASKVYSTNGTAPNICAGTHGYANGYVIPSNTAKGYEIATTEDSINFSVPNSKTRRGRVGKGVAQTLDTGCNQGVIIGAIRGRGDDNTQTLEMNDLGLSNSITTVQKDNVVIEGCLSGGKWDKTHEQSRRVYGIDGIAASVHTMSGGGQQRKILEKDEVIQLNPSLESGGKQPYQQNRVYDIQGICPAISAGQETWKGNIVNTQRIRRLTPLECFRLMDFNANFKWDVSDSQAYKQAGNSIVVACLVGIIKNLKLS